MKRRLTKEQKFEELKQFAEDQGLHVIGEDVRMGNGHIAKYIFKDPNNRTKGQLSIMSTRFDEGNLGDLQQAKDDVIEVYG